MSEYPEWHRREQFSHCLVSSGILLDELGHEGSRHPKRGRGVPKKKMARACRCSVICTVTSCISSYASRSISVALAKSPRSISVALAKSPRSISVALANSPRSISVALANSPRSISVALANSSRDSPHEYCLGVVLCPGHRHRHRKRRIIPWAPLTRLR